MRFLLATLLLISAPAFADEQKFPQPKASQACPAIASLQEESAQECSDNGKMGQAGINCYQAFQKQVKTNSAAAQLSMYAANAASAQKQGNGQAEKFANSVGDFNASTAALDGLIAAGEQAHSNVDSYLHGIYYPEDYNMEEGVFEKMYGSADEFLDGEPCFAENEKGLKDLIQRIDNDVAQLRKTRAAVQAMRATTSGHQNDTTSLNEQAHGVSAGGAPQARPVQRGLSSVPASSITGIEQDKAKSQK